MKKTSSVFVATWFFSGLISDKAAGTIGSLASLPLCALMFWSARILDGYAPCAFLIILVLAFGIWFIPSAEKDLGELLDYKGNLRSHDQNQIVIDEVLGMLIACLPLALHDYTFWQTFVLMFLAFMLFRLCDIYKFPWPVKALDNMHNAWGVMLDDAAAGAWAALGVWLVGQGFFKAG